MPQTSNVTSVPRSHSLWLAAALLAGILVVKSIWPAGSALDASEIRTYAGVLTSASASMSALALAGAGLLYTLQSFPMIKELQRLGALNRVVFNLLVCAALWLTCLGCSLLGAMPSFEQSVLFIQIAAICSIAGLLYFVPLGYAFWLLLSNASSEPQQFKANHDWSKPTKLVDDQAPHTS